MSSEQQRGSAMSALASLFIPGLGQALFTGGYRGAIWAAVVFAAWAVPSLAAGYWLGALGIGLGLSALLWLACIVDAWRRPRRPASPLGIVALVIVVAAGSTIGSVVVAVVIRTTALEAFKIPSGSMCPTLEVGDHVFVDKTVYRKQPVRVGDVIVHRTKDATGRDVDFVRRVIAVGGDDVMVDAEGRVTVRGRPSSLRSLGRTACDSASVYEEQLDGEAGTHLVAFDSSALGAPVDTVRVPDGELYLMGDNRMNSYDSRMIGTVKTDSVIGRVWRIWLRGPSAAWLPVR